MMTDGEAMRRRATSSGARATAARTRRARWRAARRRTRSRAASTSPTSSARSRPATRSRRAAPRPPAVVGAESAGGAARAARDPGRGQPQRHDAPQPRHATGYRTSWHIIPNHLTHPYMYKKIPSHVGWTRSRRTTSCRPRRPSSKVAGARRRAEIAAQRTKILGRLGGDERTWPDGARRARATRACDFVGLDFPPLSATLDTVGTRAMSPTHHLRRPTKAAADRDYAAVPSTMWWARDAATPRSCRQRGPRASCRPASYLGRTARRTRPARARRTRTRSARPSRRRRRAARPRPRARARRRRAAGAAPRGPRARRAAAAARARRRPA